MKREPEPLIYQIRAEAGADEAEILIYDFIGADFFGEGVTAKSVVEILQALKASTINVRINSGGGDVFEGNSIHNALRRHGAEIVVHIDGLAASAASVIAMAGDSVRIAENAFLMIHKSWGFVMGNSDDMRERADLLDKVDGSLVGMYVARTGREESEVREWMTDEGTWFNAEEALEAGFVDEVDEPMRAAASVDLSQLSSVPDELRARIAAARQSDPEPEPVPSGPDPAVLRLVAEVERTRARLTA